ncbi:MAG TPA: polysaccharide deacetylase family protein [Chitinophagaceae bacterium]|nr:polysaccharide deacetylase family protein [Chitinophagaceae bacterium]
MRSSILIVFAIALFSCESRTAITNAKSEKPATNTPVTNTPVKLLSAQETLNQTEVPVLCYHRIREFRATDSKSMKDYIVTPENFKSQLKMLADSGYHSILPDQLYDYLAYGKALPSKPVLLSFDDSEEEHFTIALNEMKKYGFKGVFFIMTVTMNRPGYMTKEQLKELSEEGNEIASHTWNHNNVKKYVETDWAVQVDKPNKQLEAITGKPVKYFAFPFGLWNEQAIPELKKRGIKASFQLVGKRDSTEPLYTIRRMIVPGEWNNERMMKWMKTNFK